MSTSTSSEKTITIPHRLVVQAIVKLRGYAVAMKYADGSPVMSDTVASELAALSGYMDSGGAARAQNNNMKR